MTASYDKLHLAPSIDKLLHYLLAHVKHDTEVIVEGDKDVVFKGTYVSPREISISPSLYSRLDACHGAGNCCRVPFALVYTDFDYSRIVEFDYQSAADAFGKLSADGFKEAREKLLARLVRLDVKLTFNGITRVPNIWVQRNIEVNKMSGEKSCPYLLISDDRYFCGVHPFKPLHCWYPHMVVRKHEVEGQKPSVSIGRMQYGRNHKFGCPVIFGEVEDDMPGSLIPSQGESYFTKQFADDHDKLEWTSDSAASLGFNSSENFAVGIHNEFHKQQQTIRRLIAANTHEHIPLWKNRNDITCR